MALLNSDQTALFRLLGVLAARIAASYDDMLLPADIASVVRERVTALIEEALGAMVGTAQEKPAMLNEIAPAECNQLPSIAGYDRTNLSRHWQEMSMGNREEMIQRSIPFLQEVKNMTPGTDMET